MKNKFNKHTVAVYAARFPFDITDDYVCCERRREIDGCSSVKVKQAKYYVWKLLEIALKQSFELSLAETDVSTNANGKWGCSECEFSLSHSENVAVVAVSNAAVGVDVELFSPERFDERLQRRIMTESEWAQSQMLTAAERRKFANVIWCKKEALFKLNVGRAFVPNATETDGGRCIVKTVLCDGKTFVMAVAAENIQKVEFYGINVEISDMGKPSIQ